MTATKNNKIVAVMPNTDGMTDEHKRILNNVLENGFDQKSMETQAKLLRQIQANAEKLKGEQVVTQPIGEKKITDNLLVGCHILDILGEPEPLRNIQTCLRSWYLALMLDEHCNWPDNLRQLNSTKVLYWEIDDLMDTLCENSLEIKKSDYAKEFISISIDAINKHFNPVMGLSFAKRDLREWFGSCMESFENRADNLKRYHHTYAYSTLNEVLMTLIYAEQDNDGYPDPE